MRPMFSLRRSFGVLATTTVASQVINAALVLVQSRFYTPAAVGFLANVLSVATIVSPLCSMQLPIAVPQQRDRREVAEIVAITCIAVIASFLLLNSAVALATCLHQFSSTARKIAFLGLCVAPFLILHDLGRMLAARDGAFRSIGFQSVTFAGLRAVIQVIGGLFGGGQLWLIAGDSIGRLGAIHLVRKSAAKIWRVSRAVRLDLRGALRANWRFPAISLPSTILDNLGGYLPPILIGNLYGLEVAGFFFLAQRVVSFPIVLLVQSSADVIHVRAAQLAVTDKQELVRFVIKTAGAFFFIGIAVAAAMAIFVSAFWSDIFSARWTAAREMAFALILAGIFQTACGPISRILVVSNRQALKLIFDCTYLVAGASPIFAFMAGIHLTAIDAVWTIALGYSVAYIVYLGLIVLAASRPIDLKRFGP